MRTYRNHNAGYKKVANQIIGMHKMFPQKTDLVILRERKPLKGENSLSVMFRPESIFRGSHQEALDYLSFLSDEEYAKYNYTACYASL